MKRKLMLQSKKALHKNSMGARRLKMLKCLEETSLATIFLKAF